MGMSRWGRQRQIARSFLQVTTVAHNLYRRLLTVGDRVVGDMQVVRVG